MRKVVIGLVGIALLASLSGGPHPSEAADSCSVSGGYDLNGFALGDAEVVGSLVFSPIIACTGGTFAGTITIRVDASPATVVPVSGTYSVGGDATITITAPGLVTLTGRVSQLANDLANAIHTVGDIGGAINVAVTMTRSALRGVATVLNRNASVFTLINLPTPTVVYTFTLPAGTLSGGRLVRGRLLYDYVNNTGSGKTLTIELILGATVIASQSVPTTSSASNRLGELEFVVGDTISSNFQNGGFRGVHGDPGGPVPLMAVGTGGENVGVSLPIQIRVTHGVASPDLVFRTLLVVLELV